MESLAISSDLNRVIAGGEDGDIRVWERDAGGDYVEVYTFQGHAGSVHSIAITPDDNLFVSVGPAPFPGGR